jgi:L-2-hydroxyglutarate oxidase LhgO
LHIVDKIDCLVIGAGVIGLAIARRLALAGREVVVVEAGPAIGHETSSRNSEVIHAGIYYPQHSLMARFCVAGRQALYAYCAERGIAHRRCGKLLVATDAAEAAMLDAIAAHARANGVADIARIDGGEARAREPALNAVAALVSPSTGILDSHGFMLALQGDAEAAGAMIAFNAPVLSADLTAGHVVAIGGAAPMRLACTLIVNAAGLNAAALARAMAGFPPAHVPPAYYAKGNYFGLSGVRAPFSQLIYPVPTPGGLGVHLTLDLAGAARFGPDVEWIEAPDYTVDPARADGFYAAIRRYWPGLPDGALVPAYAGIRPKTVPTGGGRQDFRIDGPAAHGIPGIIQLFGIESPGLTSALAIADHVGDIAAI